jgi:hypothetical protein
MKNKDEENKGLLNFGNMKPEPVVEQPEPVEEKKPESPIVRGSMVRFVGTKTYSGLDLSSYAGKEFRVKELSEDRVVLAAKGEVVAAVNIKDCEAI